MREIGAFGWLEHRTLEARFSIRGEQEPPPQIVVIAVDIESVRRAGRYPIPRARSAEVVDKLRRAGAKVIAFDLRLEDRTDPAADLRLAHALERTGAAVVAVKAIREGGRIQPLVGRVRYDGVRVRPGNLFLPIDSDTVVRRFPAAYKGIPSMAVVAANLKDPRVRIADAPAGALIDFAGGAGTVTSLSFIDVLGGRFSATFVRGKVAVVGATETVGGDVHATAVAGSAMSGPEIHANAIATALAGYPLRTLSSCATRRCCCSFLAARSRCLRSCGPAGAAGSAPASVIVAGARCAPGLDGRRSVGVRRRHRRRLQRGRRSPCSRHSAGPGHSPRWPNDGSAASGQLCEQRRLFADFSPELVRRVLDQSTADPAAIANTEIIAGYRIEKVIGEGGMGVVYRATQLRSRARSRSRSSAPRKRCSPISGPASSAKPRRRRCVGHPNIVPIYDAGEDDGILYIAMQLVDGIDIGEAAPPRRAAGAQTLLVTRRATDRCRARRGARARARPPRRQAREHPADQDLEPRVPHGLRGRKAARRRRRPDASRWLGRHDRLPRAGADRRQARPARAATSTRSPRCCTTAPPAPCRSICPASPPSSTRMRRRLLLR